MLDNLLGLATIAPKRLCLFFREIGKICGRKGAFVGFVCLRALGIEICRTKEISMSQNEKGKRDLYFSSLLETLLGEDLETQEPVSASYNSSGGTRRSSRFQRTAKTTHLATLDFDEDDEYGKRDGFAKLLDRSTVAAVAKLEAGGQSIRIPIEFCSNGEKFTIQGNWSSNVMPLALVGAQFKAEDVRLPLVDKDFRIPMAAVRPAKSSSCPTMTATSFMAAIGPQQRESATNATKADFSVEFCGYDQTLDVHGSLPSGWLGDVAIVECEYRGRGNQMRGPVRIPVRLRADSQGDRVGHASKVAFPWPRDATREIGRLVVRPVDWLDLPFLPPLDASYLLATRDHIVIPLSRSMDCWSFSLPLDCQRRAVQDSTISWCVRVSPVDSEES